MCDLQQETPSETSVELTSSPRAGAGETSLEITAETENVIDTYQTTAEWIRFADAKAAVVLTVNGALASVMIPTLKPFLDGARSATGALSMSTMQWTTLALFILFALLAVGSSVSAFRCILPARRGGRHPARDACRHFHPAAISEHYQQDDVDRFQADFEKTGRHGFQREVLAGLLIDSHISASKYTHVTASIRILGLAAVAGFAYLTLTQL